MNKRGAAHYTPADVIAHATKNRLPLPMELRPNLPDPAELRKRVGSRKLPQPVAMSRPEREAGMMLEAQKRNGEIVDYIFQGVSLAYGADPETGIQLRYKCDYVVIERVEDWPLMKLAGIKIIECKGHGKHAISAAAKLRFKGAKAAWPMFKFEMHQRQRDGTWSRVL